MDLEHAQYYAAVDKLERQQVEPKVVTWARLLLDMKDEWRDGDEDSYTESDHLFELVTDWLRKKEGKKPSIAETVNKILKASAKSPTLGELIAMYEKALSAELTLQTTNERIRYIEKWADDVGRSMPIGSLIDSEEAYQCANRN